MSGKTCPTCGKVLHRRNKTGYCLGDLNRLRAADPAYCAKISVGLRRAFALDPVLAAANRARAAKLHLLPHVREMKRARWTSDMQAMGVAAQPKGSEPRLRAGRRVTAQRLGDIPPELRDQHRWLTRSKGFSAAEAREIIAREHELALARWRRTIEPAPLVARARPVMPTGDVADEQRAAEFIAPLLDSTAAAIFGDKRDAITARARFAVILVLHRRGYTSNAIARRLGYADHSAVVHGIRRGHEIELRDLAFADAVLAARAALVRPVEAAA